MKRILTLGLALLMLILAGCSTEVTEYRQQQPALDIFHYFQGRTEAWGWCRIVAASSCAASM
ncbi:lipoprotein [Klebsiella variicola]|nr:lipoprotein [Klebsiella variicola]